MFQLDRHELSLSLFVKRNTQKIDDMILACTKRVDQRDIVLPSHRMLSFTRSLMAQVSKRTQRRHDLANALKIVVEELVKCDYDDAAGHIVTALAMSERLNKRDEKFLLNLIEDGEVRESYVPRSLSIPIKNEFEKKLRNKNPYPKGHELHHVNCDEDFCDACISND